MTSKLDLASSAALPGLDRSPGKNWVDALPAPLKAAWHRSLIYRSAKHQAAKGRPVGIAIASAVNWAKHICATGDVKQWKGPQQVSPKSRAEACAAVATWNAMKAAASKADLTETTRAMFLVELVAADKRQVVDLSEPEAARLPRGFRERLRHAIFGPDLTS